MSIPISIDSYLKIIVQFMLFSEEERQKLNAMQNIGSQSIAPNSRDTNCCIQQLSIDKGQFLRTFYIPAYLRLDILNVKSFNIMELGAEMLTTIYLTLGLRGFKYYIIKNYGDEVYQFLYFMMKNKIQLTFSRSDFEQVNDEKADIQEEQNQFMKFILRKQMSFDVKVVQQFFSPYNLIELKTWIKVNDIYENFNGKQYKIFFNLMDTNNSFAKLSYEKGFYFEDYQVANTKNLVTIYHNKFEKDVYEKQRYRLYRTYGTGKLRPCQRQIRIKRYKSYKQKHFSTFENKEKRYLYEQTSQVDIIEQKYEGKDEGKEQEKQSKWQQGNFQNYTYGHFKLVMAKRPFTTLVTFIAPIWLLSTLVILVTFQDTALTDRVANLAALVLTFAVLLKQLKQSAPPFPKTTLLQHFVFIHMILSLIPILQTISLVAINYRNDAQSQVTNDIIIGNNNGDVWFQILSILIWLDIGCTIILILLEIFLILYGQFKTKSYLDKRMNESRLQLELDDKSEWFNKDCDQQLHKYINDKNAHYKRNIFSFVPEYGEV